MKSSVILVWYARSEGLYRVCIVGITANCSSVIRSFALRTPDEDDRRLHSSFFIKRSVLPLAVLDGGPHKPHEQRVRLLHGAFELGVKLAGYEPRMGR